MQVLRPPGLACSRHDWWHWNRGSRPKLQNFRVHCGRPSSLVESRRPEPQRWSSSSVASHRRLQTRRGVPLPGLPQSRHPSDCEQSAQGLLQGYGRFPGLCQQVLRAPCQRGSTLHTSPPLWGPRRRVPLGVPDLQASGYQQRRCNISWLRCRPCRLGSRPGLLLALLAWHRRCAEPGRGECRARPYAFQVNHLMAMPVALLADRWASAWQCQLIRARNQPRPSTAGRRGRAAQ
mmetsp:Transcript_17408/g.38071  ORF Transcript_17408/g.38071 Transcript_17408/m.38071 type:complete len:234 (-) Transcript_17408:869-1570(-)